MNIKYNWIFLLIVILIVLSCGVLAEVTVPADAFSGIGDVFSGAWESLKGLFVGEITYESAYFFTLIAYLVIFLAIFVEGLKFIPFFGGKGEINGAGIAFAIAAAVLATLAIFVTDKSGTSTRNIVTNALNPFGVWGIIALVGLVALISYKGIRDLGIFGDSVLKAMAVAVGMGVIGVGYLVSPRVLSWGAAVLMIAIAVGLITHLAGKFTSRKGKSVGDSKAKAMEKVREMAKAKGTKKPWFSFGGGKKGTKRVERDVKRTEEYEELGVDELKKLTKTVEKAETPKDLNKVQKLIRRLGKVEKRATKNLVRVEADVNELGEELSEPELTKVKNKIAGAQSRLEKMVKHFDKMEEDFKDIYNMSEEDKYQGFEKLKAELLVDCRGMEHEGTEMIAALEDVEITLKEINAINEASKKQLEQEEKEKEQEREVDEALKKRTSWRRW